MQTQSVPEIACGYIKDTSYYKSLYNRFIDSRRDRDISDGGYYELHHIRPRSMGGQKIPENEIYLTLKEHYFAHLILVKAYPNVKGLKNAICAMIGSMRCRSNGRFTSRDFHLARELATHKIPARQELLDLYFEQNMSMRDLGIEYGVSDMTICKWFNVYDIKARTPQEQAKRKSFEMRPTKKELGDLYKKLGSTIKVAQVLNCSASSVYKWSKQYGITLNPNRRDRTPLDKDILVNLYHVKGLTSREVAEQLKESRRTVLYYIRKYNIPTRIGNIPTRKRASKNS